MSRRNVRLIGAAGRASPRALVTGASGMLGGNLVERLLAERAVVRALVRPCSDTSYLETLPVELVRGDLTVESDAGRAVAGVDLVFHVAGYLTFASAFGDSPGGFERYRRANVEVTDTLLHASARASVARFVYASSAAVYDPRSRCPIEEDAPLEPVSDYGRSKLLAEERVRAYAGELATTIVRPCIVYGDGDRYFLPGALGLASLPVLPLVDGGRHLIDLVHARDVAELMWSASQSEAAVGRAYNAASGAPLPLRQLIAEIAALLGKTPRTCSVPRQLLRRILPLARSYVRAFSPDAESLLSRTGLELIARDLHFDITRAGSELGYAPRTDRGRGLAAAVDAYRRGPNTTTVCARL